MPYPEGDIIATGGTVEVRELKVPQGEQPLVKRVSLEPVNTAVLMRLITELNWDKGPQTSLQLGEYYPNTNEYELAGVEFNLANITPAEMRAFVSSYNDGRVDDSDRNVLRHILSSYVTAWIDDYYKVRGLQSPVNSPLSLSYVVNPTNRRRMTCEIIEPQLVQYRDWKSLNRSEFYDAIQNNQSGLAKFAEYLEVLAVELATLNRDLKPEHFLVDKANQKIMHIDHGLALFNRITQATNMMRGTLVYMHPDSMAAKPASMPTEIYSLATMCYELLVTSPRITIEELENYVANSSLLAQLTPEVYQQKLTYAFASALARNQLIGVEIKYIDEALAQLGLTDLGNDIVDLRDRKIIDSQGQEQIVGRKANGLDAFKLFIEYCLNNGQPSYGNDISKSEQWRAPASHTVFAMFMSGLLSRDRVERHHTQVCFEAFVDARNVDIIEARGSLYEYLLNNEAFVDIIYPKLNPLGIYGSHIDLAERCWFLARKIVLQGDVDLHQLKNHA